MIRTNSSRNVTVGTTNRSAATIWLAWLVRNVRHVCDGGRGCRRMYLATVDWLTEIPSFKAPHEAAAHPRADSLSTARGLGCARLLAQAGRPSTFSTLPGPEQAKAAAVPCEDGLRLDNVDGRAPAAPCLRQPRPQQSVGRAEPQSVRPRSVDDSQLVSERDDFQVQRGAGPNHQPKRVGQRDDDTDHEASLFETGGNLNPDNAYRVSDTHSSQ
jgi:hypothetical protein